jgi:DNA helicase-2/ATP-dependent DNA helicase PcrA
MPAPSETQRAAIEAPLGPTLVVAGPGAGKTFCLIGRIGHLIEKERLDPARILAVTFTNKAAEEVAERLVTELGDAARQVKRGTLHAVCAELLREHGRAVLIDPGFGIADEVYQYLVLDRLGIWKKRRGQLLTLFGRRRLQSYQLSDSDERIYERYRAHLRGRNLLDFDDLIAETARLLTERPDIAGTIRARWDAVLVDEFQDLDPTQYGLLHDLSLDHRNLFAVGDDEQSIFAWRGADPTVLQKMAGDFGIATPIVLDKNRRCSVQIFERARRLVVQNPSLWEKAIVAERESRHEVEAYRFADEDDEAHWITDDLRRDRTETGRDWGEYALLYRTHAIGNHLEAKLVEAGIPCRLARGRSLKDDEAIQYVLAALRVLRRPDDPLMVEALAEIRIANLVGDVRRAMRDTGKDFLDTLAALARKLPKTDPDRSKLWRFFYDVENLKALMHRHDDLMSIVEDLLAKPVGEFTNILERHHDELSDPADNPEVVALADELAGALDGRRDVRVVGDGGAQIALRGMLLEGGVTTVEYASTVDRSPLETLTVHRSPFTVARSDDQSTVNGQRVTVNPLAVDADPLTGFKALQLLHSRALESSVADLTAFDLETTGLDVEHCEIVEVAAVRVRNGVAVERFHRLVRPERAIEYGASETHGYTAADLCGAQSFAAVWPEFRAFVGDDLLVAHNGFEFDIPVLEHRVNALGDLEELARFKQLVFFDSLPLARDLVPGSAKLENVARTFGIEIERAHHALDDAEALGRVFMELQKLETARVRKTSMAHLLEWLAVGLALSPRSPSPAERERGTGGEGERLFDRIKIFPLGPYSDVLDQYGSERAHLADDSLPTVEQLIAALGGQRLMQKLRVEKTAEQRYPEAVARLRTVIEATRGGSLTEHVDRFLERVTLLTTSEGTEVARHRVNLLTLHATKGLEFQCVYLVGVEDGEFLRGRGDDEISATEIEEARRLIYVGMTRAIDRLVITTVDRRNGWTHGKSRFLEEMGLAPTPATP